MTTNIKYAFVLMCLILSYGFCSFAKETQVAKYEKITISESGITIQRSPQSVVANPSQDSGPIEKLLPLYENPYKDFEPDDEANNH